MAVVVKVNAEQTVVGIIKTPVQAVSSTRCPAGSIGGRKSSSRGGCRDARKLGDQVDNRLGSARFALPTGV